MGLITNLFSVGFIFTILSPALATSKAPTTRDLEKIVLSLNQHPTIAEWLKMPEFDSEKDIFRKTLARQIGTSTFKKLAALKTKYILNANGTVVAQIDGQDIVRWRFESISPEQIQFAIDDVKYFVEPPKSPLRAQLLLLSALSLFEQGEEAQPKKGRPAGRDRRGALLELIIQPAQANPLAGLIAMGARTLVAFFSSRVSMAAASATAAGGAGTAQMSCSEVKSLISLCEKVLTSPTKPEGQDPNPQFRELIHQIAGGLRDHKLSQSGARVSAALNLKSVQTVIETVAPACTSDRNQELNRCVDRIPQIAQKAGFKTEVIKGGNNVSILTIVGLDMPAPSAAPPPPSDDPKDQPNSQPGSK